MELLLWILPIFLAPIFRIRSHKRHKYIYYEKTKWVIVKELIKYYFEAELMIIFVLALEDTIQEEFPGYTTIIEKITELLWW